MLYLLIRHGQCITNIHRDYAPASNDEDLLTELGCEQAVETARVIEKFKIKKLKIASSSLARARQTASIIFEALNLEGEIYYSDLLIEKSSEESFSDANTRYETFVNEFVNDDDLTLIIITHGHVLQAVFANLIELRDPTVLDFQNCSISAYKNKRVLTINSYIHLINQ